MENQQQARPLRHIAVAGNIGAGKTTLTTQLGKHFDWNILYEDVDQNPYLDDFYEDMRRWSFNLQIYFLNSRFGQVKQIQQGDRVTIQDRTIYEDAHIFAPNLYEMGLMLPRDFENYTTLFKNMSSFLAPPDLLIYLRASTETLLNQIKRRGRSYEANIRPDYLHSLNHYYETWINNYTEGKLLIINIDELNYADHPHHLQQVIDQISQALQTAS